MSTKHTKGPWGVYSCDDSTTVEIRDSRGLVIAEVGDSSLEDEANARLIAAAPELLTLLQDWVNDFADCLEGGEENELVSATRAAIAKATGGAA